MIKIESLTLEQAYKDAAAKLECSVTQLSVEVVQVPSRGIFGLFKKNAIIVAAKKNQDPIQKVATQDEPKPIVEEEVVQEQKLIVKDEPKIEQKPEPKPLQNNINEIILPETFVSTQDENIDDEMQNIAKEVESDINRLFDLSCFSMNRINVSVYDDKTLFFEFDGEDAALLIGKEGYRYKALSYMIFNWVNSKYDLQIRLEIAEFLKNQEESVLKYLQGVYESVDRDGKAQTKTLDGVLIQIALRELRDRYPYKYVAIRTTRDGLRYIIINENYSL
ncbi:MAG: Jag N-terminal domain-containing protein [Sulfurimonas sp.]|jgi:spoIIIJ-associated protein|nr:Jag N-terminal domain-containing protein [Sulfurimonadaceae bacterium]